MHGEQIHAWIVGRCWFSMRARFQKVSYRGPDGLNLIDRLRNWRPFVGELQSSKEFRGNWFKSVGEIFEDLGLKPTSPGTYTLNASTAVKWIGLIATILTVLNRMFEEEEQSTSKVLDSDRVQVVAIFTRALYAIFCNEELQDLFGLESLKMVTPTKGTWPNLSADDDSDDELPTLRGDYIPVGLRRSPAGDSLFRFLRTLTTWQKSVSAIFGASSRLQSLSSLKVCWVSLTMSEKLDDESSFLESVMRVFDNRRIDTSKREAVRAWITEQLRVERIPARIHAEAGLIALAYDVYHGRVDSHSANGYTRALKVPSLQLLRHSAV
ncbi:hypothetical protein M413DRAFT_326741 [Hebeloma cylindrosporum]|uniref:Uncharacterized protein n=1 Tax=Hebeloma cylindrosporum TaxID=76867 RepID=A0A0C2XCQ2_HEBCY|nr:hypothetical protein M413DRAFT_326741 [Hebeloma cylindrosporum h7]